MHVLRQGRSQWTQHASYHDVVQLLTNHLDSGFGKCLFNTIPFQVCFHILHIVYLGLRGYQAFPSGWGWFDLKVLRLTTVSAVNFSPRAKKNKNNLDNINDWLRLETPTKALLQLTWKPREYAPNTQYPDGLMKTSKQTYGAFEMVSVGSTVSVIKKTRFCGIDAKTKTHNQGRGLYRGPLFFPSK